ncbi:MAG: DEAD/DEAH box helicase [Verrucomicrobia bacterium]|nr:DEAD/DEAH box helicase [Verrucomicrobiota bacterium]
MNRTPFSPTDSKEGEELLKAGKVGELLFSEGTYQAEVREGKNESVWPFLQIDEEGNLIDCFCTCPVAEKHRRCPHLYAAYQKIFHGKALPLHIRFRDSLWNHLCLMASRRHGYDASAIKQQGQVYSASSSTHKVLFTIEGKTPAGKKRLKEILFERAVETEETSLKFSNLSPEEIALWKEGKPSVHLQYELSFWSDLAKWFMGYQEQEDPYQIQFEGEEGALPQWIQIQFADVVSRFYIAEANWSQLIPSLSTVLSPLPVHEFQGGALEKIEYDAEKQRFLITSAPPKKAERILPQEEGKGIAVGEWLFFPKKGFFPARSDSLFGQKEISKERIASVLSHHGAILKKYLANAKIHTNPQQVQCRVFFDKKQQLHLEAYLFAPNDLQQEGAACFGPWAYLPSKGFYRLENQLFEGATHIVPREGVSEFVNRHRVWLGGFEGFQTHVHTIESQVSYSVSKEGTLLFETSLELIDGGEEMYDFGEWIYLKGKGFFARRIGRSGAFIRPGTSVLKMEVPIFIRAHREELEQLPGFFTEKCPLEKSELEIFLNETGRIVVRPHFHWHPFYDPSAVKIFGDFTYVEGEGFSEIPYEKRVPEAYTRERIITLTDENYFILYELEALKNYIFSIQKELKKPKDLYLRVLRLQKSGRTKAPEWVMDLVLESELGRVELYEIWRAVQDNKRYLFSSAGLILLKHPRFNWLKTFPKKRWLKEGKQLRLSTIDWMRLAILEDLRPPPPGTPEDNKTRQLMGELGSFQTDQPIDLAGFKSELRTYQEMGVRWLWFLYLNGLSGLLCDEMGLGKTHQAMGLIAVLKNASDQKKKFLVVCPTSVIYHWEELLKKFLPELRVHTFYGITRTLSPIEEKADLLLTSYGILRSEREALSAIPFELAIFDELQIAKNPQSQTHKALKKIDAAMRLGLTGTPIENRLQELKALFDVVVPGYLPQESHFKELFINPIEKHQDAEKKALLSKLVKPFILRRKKAEVLLELPEKIEEISYCDLSEEQRELYKKAFFQHKDALIQDLENPSKPVPLLHVFAMLSALKQICDHPCLYTKQVQDFRKHQSGKWDLFVELLDEIRDSGQKVVIFSQYLDMLSMMEAYLKEHKIGYASIRGSTRDRKAQLDMFREDPNCEVFLASLQAVGVGVDLVSASVVIHYDRWWNPARENQATDRVHRIGQNRGVQVFKMVTKGTIEEHIHHLIERKLTLMEGVIGFDEQDQIKGLDREELLQLLWLINKDVDASSR